MIYMKIDFSSLHQAFESFKLGYEILSEDPSNLISRDACIQRFEYTYELSVKMIKRQLEQESSIPSEIDRMNFKDRIRVAAEKGILQNPEIWFGFREMRNITSHTYDNTKAEQIVHIFPEFLHEVSNLISNFDSRK